MNPAHMMQAQFRQMPGKFEPFEIHYVEKSGDLNKCVYLIIVED
jgi:hypothetical protein